jgi:hypothetical protein
VQRTFEGKVQLLLPQVEDQTRTATARIVLPNPDGYLRPGMFTDVRFAAQLTESAVLVPDMAVLRSGERNTVFIAKDGGSFEPRVVTLGSRSEGNFYDVLSGLAVGDRVVTSGQFMLDSESQLREAIQKMLKGDTAAATPTAAKPADARKIKYYKSPMTPGEISDKPGKDSMGMDLVPVYEGEEKPGGAPPTGDAPHAMNDHSATGEARIAAALPPGHPPLDRATLVAFTRLQSVPAGKDEAAAGSDTCGSCGMSQVAMAAAEPCAHDNK